MLLLIIVYSLVIAFLPPLSHQGTLALHFGHALAWCIFHCFGLGLLLNAQSKNKFLVRHFLKNYHYQQNDVRGGAVMEAFANWKSLYNLSMCMTYSASFDNCRGSVKSHCSLASFIGLVWKTYSIPNDWSVGNELLRHTLGAVRWRSF